MARIKKKEPIQPVFCPHCRAPNFATGIGMFKCMNCKREFFYEGPFHMICSRCKVEIDLMPITGTTNASCPQCGQVYNLKNPKTYPKSTSRKCLEACADCGECVPDCA
ncbi:MAG: hypothetical protein ACFFDT_21110 [Candidatus Hodarchaeota archaeon]